MDVPVIGAWRCLVRLPRVGRPEAASFLAVNHRVVNIHSCVLTDLGRHLVVEVWWPISAVSYPSLLIAQLKFGHNLFLAQVKIDFSKVRLAPCTHWANTFQISGPLIHVDASSDQKSAKDGWDDRIYYNHVIRRLLGFKLGCHTISFVLIKVRDRPRHILSLIFNLLSHILLSFVIGSRVILERNTFIFGCLSLILSCILSSLVLCRLRSHICHILWRRRLWLCFILRYVLGSRLIRLGEIAWLIQSLVGGCRQICRCIVGDCLIQSLVVRISSVARNVARVCAVCDVRCLVNGWACVREVISLISCLVSCYITRRGSIHRSTSIACLVHLSCIMSLISGCTHILCLILCLISKLCLILCHIICLILRLSLICRSIIRLSRVSCRVYNMISGIRRLRCILCLITCSISLSCVITCCLIISSVSSILGYILGLILSDIRGLISLSLILNIRCVLMSLILTTRRVRGNILSGRVRSQIPTGRILSRIYRHRIVLSLIPAGLVLSRILSLICLSWVRSRILRDILSQVLSHVLCSILCHILSHILRLIRGDIRG